MEVGVAFDVPYVVGAVGYDLLVAVDETLWFPAGDSESRDSRSREISTTMTVGLGFDSPARMNYVETCGSSGQLCDPHHQERSNHCTSSFHLA
jgi:hypothetical protein